MLDQQLPLAEILVPMDFSECSVKALKFAMRIAAAFDARLHLLWVDDDPILIQTTTDQSFRDAHEAKMVTKFDDVLTAEERERFRVLTLVRAGTAYHEIEMYAAEAGIELIIMGNRGHSRIANVFLGSVTAHVVRHAPCPVLSVKRVYGETADA